MSRQRLHLLVLYWTSQGDLNKLRPAIRHHAQFLETGPGCHRVVYWNVRDRSPAWLGWLAWDAVILHTTLLCLRWSHLFTEVRWRLDWLRHLRCPLVAMPQDEYDHAHVLDEWLYALGTSVICSNFDESLRPLLYPLMQDRAVFRKCFTGYLQEDKARELAPKLQPAARRPLDLVYRAARLPYWFGSQGQLKHNLADIVLARARSRGLRCNISTRDEDAITSDRWFDFLASSRAVLGCESGSSVLDRRGEVRARIRWLLAREPGLTFEQVAARMPADWDQYRFFAVGPRHFEAVLTRTCQVLIEGQYEGVLRPGIHYLPLRRDFANLDEVLAQVEDAALLDRITARAYEDICLSGRYTYATLAHSLEELLPARPMYLRWLRHPFAMVVLLDVSMWPARFLYACTQPVALAARLAVRCWSAVRTVAARVADGGRMVRRLGRSLGLLLGHRAFRRTWRSGLLSLAMWKSGAVRLFLRELVKLTTLHQHLRGVSHMPRPLPVLAAREGKLLFVSWPSAAGAEEGACLGSTAPAALARAIRAGTIREVWWEHSQPGKNGHQPADSAEGNGCSYRFVALEELARHRPDHVRSLLLDLVGLPEQEPPAASPPPRRIAVV